MNKTNKEIKGSGIYYVLLCYSGRNKLEPLLCGVYPSKKEAKEIAKEVKDCPAKHVIKKCKVKIILI